MGREELGIKEMLGALLLVHTLHPSPIHPSWGGTDQPPAVMCLLERTFSSPYLGEQMGKQVTESPYEPQSHMVDAVQREVQMSALPGIGDLLLCLAPLFLHYPPEDGLVMIPRRR